MNVLVVSSITQTIIGLHIHGPAYIGESASVLVPLIFAQSSGNYFVTVPANFASLANSGQLYLNVHTNAWPNGEIRGQIYPLGQICPLQPSTTGAVAATTGSTGSSGSTTHATSASSSLTCSIVVILSMIALLPF